MARTAADSAPTQAKTSAPSDGSSAATASASRVLSPGGVPAAVQPAHRDPGRAPGPAAPPRRRPPRARASAAGPGLRPRRGCGRSPAARSRRRRAAPARPAARRAARRRPRRAVHPGRGRGRPRGGRAVAVQDEVDVHLAGGRVLAAGGVAAQAHPVAADGPHDAAVPGDLRPARARVADARDEQRDRRSRGGDRVRGPGQRDPADRRRHLGDGGDGEDVDRPQDRRPRLHAGRHRLPRVGGRPGEPGAEGRPGRPRGNGVDRAGDRGRAGALTLGSENTRSDQRSSRGSPPSLRTLRDRVAPAIAPAGEVGVPIG